MELGDIDITELVAVIGALGALAAVLTDDSGSAQPIINIPEGFGQSDDSASETDEYLTDNPTGGSGDSSNSAGSGDWQDTEPAGSDSSSGVDFGEYLTDGFNWQDRTDMVDDDNSESDGGTWVGL
jgi:hypothetical protein